MAITCRHSSFFSFLRFLEFCGCHLTAATGVSGASFIFKVFRFRLGGEFRIIEHTSPILTAFFPLMLPQWRMHRLKPVGPLPPPFCFPFMSSMLCAFSGPSDDLFPEFLSAACFGPCISDAGTRETLKISMSRVSLLVAFFKITVTGVFNPRPVSMVPLTFFTHHISQSPLPHSRQVVYQFFFFVDGLSWLLFIFLFFGDGVCPRESLKEIPSAPTSFGLWFTDRGRSRRPKKADRPFFYPTLPRPLVPH